jgi:hypothetical protein
MASARSYRTFKDRKRTAVRIAAGSRRISAQLGVRGVGLGWGVFRRIREAFAVRDEDEVGGDIVAEEAPRAQLDGGKAG